MASTAEERLFDLLVERGELLMETVDVEIMRRFSPSGQVRYPFPAWAPSALAAGTVGHIAREDMPAAVMRSFGGYRKAIESYRAAGELVIGDDDLEELEDWLLAEARAQFVEDVGRMFEQARQLSGPRPARAPSWGPESVERGYWSMTYHDWVAAGRPVGD